MPKAYVLLSGGIDSTTCMAIANRDWEGRLAAVCFIYGQRHTKEVQHARQVASAYDAAFIEKDISNIVGKGGITDNELVIPNVSYDDLPKGVSPTYVPFRNGTLLSCITGMAAADDEARAVYFGAHADDAANWAYPDCSPEFTGAMANAIHVGTYHKIRLITPLIFDTKVEVIKRGWILDAPYQLTWSCYKGEEFHCGICPTCRARRDGFVGAGVHDPTTYASSPEDGFKNEEMRDG